jgi:hypothetical protein
MNARFQDLENEQNPRNGEVLSDRPSVVALLDKLRGIQPPFMCQFVGDNGFNLTVGIDREFGCVQHSANDGMPPYLMAVSTNAGSDDRELEFVVGGTATPIDGRYRLRFHTVTEVVAEFVTSGQKSSKVVWEELAPDG